MARDRLFRGSDRAHLEPAQLLRKAQREVGGEVSSVQHLLEQWSKRDPGLAAWREPLATSIIEWASHSSSFTDVRLKLHANIADLPDSVGVLELAELRRLLSSLGFFSTAPVLLGSIIDQIPAPRLPLTRLTRRRVRSEIAAGSPGFADRLTHLGLLTSSQMVRSYLYALRSHPVERPSRFRHVIFGPGPVDTTSFEVDSEATTVSRVMMPGVTRWDSSDVFGGRADIAYFNGMTAQWIGSLTPGHREQVLACAHSFRTSSKHGWMRDYKNVVMVPDIKPLYLTGSPNMIPTMAVDQIIGGADHVHILGTSFFLGASPYRESQRREFPVEGKKSDEFGSIGSDFERCKSMSSHDQFVNRAIIKNLHNAGRVTGDQAFERAISLSDTQFADELEETYGRERR